MRKILGRDAEGRVIDIEIISDEGSLDGNGDGGGEHPNLAAHESLGLATDADLTTHAATPHGGGAHPDLATHDALGLATDTELTTHAATAHGTQAHAIDGASHTGSLVHAALGTVTADQHHTESHASRHGSAGADAVTPAAIGASATGHNHDAAYEASGAVSTHAGAADPHTGYLQESAHTAAAHTAMAELATQAELDTHAGTSHGVTAHGSLTGITADQHHARQHSITAAADHTFPGGSTFLRADGTFATPAGGGGEAFPVGSVFIAVVATNPATLLGYGTWSAFAAGRVLVGLDAGQTEFDTVEETGGAKTHTLTVAEMPSHTHVETNNSATTGGLVGFAARDTSTNTQTATGYSTEATGGGGAHNNLQPYITVHMWKRTA